MSETAPLPEDQAQPATVAEVEVVTPTSARTQFEAVWLDIAATWLEAHVMNGPIARNTEAFNHLVLTALPALRQAIAEKI